MVIDQSDPSSVQHIKEGFNKFIGVLWAGFLTPFILKSLLKESGFGDLLILIVPLIMIALAIFIAVYIRKISHSKTKMLYALLTFVLFPFGLLLIHFPVRSMVQKKLSEIK